MAMDLPWGLTNTSGHLAMDEMQEYQTLTPKTSGGKKAPSKVYTVHDVSEATPSSSTDKRKEKRRNRRRRKQTSSSNGSIKQRISQSSWGCLDITSSEHCQQVVSAAEVTLKKPKDMEESKTRRRQKQPHRNSIGSWAGLDISEFHFQQALGEHAHGMESGSKNNEKTVPRKSSWARLGDDMAGEDDRSTDPTLSLSVSTHSKSSWAGLDIFGEIDMAGYEPSNHHNQAQDNKANVEDDDDSTSTFATETDDVGDAFDVDREGVPEQQPKKCLWLDFDLDDLSDSDSESDYESEDEDYSSEDDSDDDGEEESESGDDDDSIEQ